MFPLVPSSSLVNVHFVLDAGVLINLLAIKAEVARAILQARGAEYYVVARAIDRELIENYCVRGITVREGFDMLAAGGVIRLASLGDESIDRFVELATVIDDGEAATVAYAEHIRGTAVLDGVPGDHLIDIASVDIERTVDLLMHRSAIDMLGRQVVADAVFDALRFVRMRVPVTALNQVVDLIGIERAATCPSLSRQMWGRFKLGEASHSG